MSEPNPRRLSLPVPFGSYTATIVEAQAQEVRGEVRIVLVWEAEGHRWGDMLRDPDLCPDLWQRYRDKNIAVGWSPGSDPAGLVGRQMQITVVEHRMQVVTIRNGVPVCRVDPYYDIRVHND